MSYLDDAKEVIIAEFETYWDEAEGESKIKNCANKDELKILIEGFFTLGFATGMKKANHGLKMMIKDEFGINLDEVGS